MTLPVPSAAHDAIRITEDPTGWAPPEAPLDMPCQPLERATPRLDLLSLLRLLLPGQRI